MSAVPLYLLDRRAALFGVTILALLFAGLLAAPVVWAFQSQAQDIDDAMSALSQEQSEIAALPAFKDRLRQVSAQRNSFEGFIHAANLSLAQAQLQSAVKSLVES